MAADRYRRTTGIPATRPFSRTTGVIGLLLVLTSCRLLGGAPVAHNSSTEQDIVAAGGWTRIAITESYLIVANVLPGEGMFTSAEVDAEHPIEGELIISGTGRALSTNSRHIETHIYDRRAGVPLTDLKPTIVVLNRTTGELIEVEGTLMQDVNIGALDIHYGNNVAVVGNSDLRLTITVGDEEAIFDGHLD